jgi:hypothetical protein
MVAIAWKSAPDVISGRDPASPVTSGALKHPRLGKHAAAIEQARFAASYATTRPAVCAPWGVLMWRASPDRCDRLRPRGCW